MAASEMRRLLYVATTRARDQLVVTCFGRLRNKDGKPASVLLGPLADALPAPGAAPPSEERDERGVLVLPPREAPPRLERDEAPDVAALLAARAAWAAGRRALLERAARPAPATSPSALEQVDEGVRGGGPGAPAGRARALALGSAVHRVMELADFDDERSLPGLAGAVCVELGWPDLAERAAALAGACWRSAPVRAAARSAETHRELPIGVLVDDIVVSGAVDLLYRDGEEWVIVDYKTDGDADERLLRERYTPQGAAYALAVEAATGGAVREVVFVAAAADGLAVPVPVDDALRRIGAGGGAGGGRRRPRHPRRRPGPSRESGDRHGSRSLTSVRRECRLASQGTGGGACTSAGYTRGVHVSAHGSRVLTLRASLPIRKSCGDNAEAGGECAFFDSCCTPSWASS